MRARHKIALLYPIVLSLMAGCRAAKLHHQTANVEMSQSRAFDGLGLYPMRFDTLNDLWRIMVKSFEESAYLQPFEKDGMEIAVCVRGNTGIGANELLIYMYDKTSNQWSDRVCWDTMSRGSNEVIGVNIAFDSRSGLLEARSAGGCWIFRANIAAFSSNLHEGQSSNAPELHYPIFRTLEELNASAEQDGRLSVFEDNENKIAVREHSRGTARSKRIVVYTFDDFAKFWEPRVIWDTGAIESEVAFDRTSEIIEVRSSGGALVFQTNMTALKARRFPWGW